MRIKICELTGLLPKVENNFLKKQWYYSSPSSCNTQIGPAA
jgi:hypothetical protein